MRTLLLVAGLALSLPARVQEAHTTEAPQVPVPLPRPTIAVPEEASQPKGAAKPVPKAAPRKPPAGIPEQQRRLAEAQAMAARLIADNAHLQQEMARAQGISYAEIATPEAALAELQAGNARFVSGKRVRTLLSMQDGDLRGALAKGQAPFAAVVTCSDSRLADNLLFDQELGRLFTIREAGNSPDIQGLASIEYALEHLGSKLVVVLGHTACGAVKAVREAHGKPLPGHLWSLQAAMSGLLETTPEDPNESPADHVNRLGVANAQRQAQAILDRSELVRHLAAAGKVKVVAALYDLASGQVRFLDPPKPATAPAPH